MLNKIYFAILGVSVALTAFFTYYSWTWLQSVGQPAAAAEGFAYSAGIAWSILLLSSVVMLVLANAILWKSGKTIAIWVTFLYFAIFAIASFVWLDPLAFQFKKINNLAEGSFSAGPIFGVLIVIIAGVLVFADQFAVVRLERKMYPKVVEPEIVEPPPIEDAG